MSHANTTTPAQLTLQELTNPENREKAIAYAMTLWAPLGWSLLKSILKSSQNHR